VFLTRPPRSTSEEAPVRLACIRHAASVVPEPGSNSPSRSPYGVIYLVMQPNQHMLALPRTAPNGIAGVCLRCTNYASVVKVLAAKQNPPGRRVATLPSRFRVSVTWCLLLPLSRGSSSEPLPAQESLNSIFILHVPCQLQGALIRMIRRSFPTGRPQPTRGNTTHPRSGCQGQFSNPSDIRCDSLSPIGLLNRVQATHTRLKMPPRVPYLASHDRRAPRQPAR
jgi:hypothetical protein